MRLHEVLTEAPIGTLDFYRPDEQGSINEPTRRHMATRTFRPRIIQAFSRLPQRINLVFYNYETRGALADRRNGELVSGCVPVEVAQASMPEIAFDPEAITVVYTENDTTGLQIPLTPWIVAHRMFHAVEFTHPDHTPAEVRDAVADCFETFFAALAPPKWPKSRAYIGTDDGRYYALPNSSIKRERSLVYQICTTRACRTRTLTNLNEVIPEMFAQYCLQGGVKLLHHHRLDTRKLAADMDACFSRVLDRIQGHVLVF